jgi:hypothetical protein
MVQLEDLAWWLEDVCHKSFTADRYPPSEPDDFVGFLGTLNGVSFRPGKKKELLDHVSVHWETLRNCMVLYRNLFQHYSQQKIGQITIESPDPDDEKKIFELINTGGSALSAVEILSSRKNWDVAIADDADDSRRRKLRARVDDLYERIGIPRRRNYEIRRWDIAASLLDRLPDNVVVGGIDPDASTRAFERQLTIGFQLYSGYYRRAISKKDLLALPEVVPMTDWVVDPAAHELNELNGVLRRIDEFVTLASWKAPLVSFMSDAVAIDFYLRSMNVWKNLDEPTNLSSTDGRLFRSRVLALLDGLVWEYVHREWRGASDNRIAVNLAALPMGDRNAEIPIVPETDWRELVHSITNDQTVRGRVYTGSVNRSKGEWVTRLDRSVVAPLLFYREVIRSRRGGNALAEIDHIIPRGEWKSLTPKLKKDTPLRQLEDSIINLSLLDPDANKAKSNRTLEEVSLKSAALRNKVSHFTDIPLDLFQELSKPKSAPELKKLRARLINWDLVKQRTLMLEDPYSFQFQEAPSDWEPT